MLRGLSFVALLLCGCALPYEQRFDAEYEGYHTHLLLATDDQSVVMPLERLSEIQWAVEQAWNIVHPEYPIQDCLTNIYVYVPATEEELNDWCDKTDIAACIYASGPWPKGVARVGDGPLMLIHPDYFASLDHPSVYGGLYVHELLHRASYCGFGDADTDHNDPRIWYPVAMAAYELANVPHWE